MAVTWDSSSDTGERLASGSPAVSWMAGGIVISRPQPTVLLRCARHAVVLLLLATAAWRAVRVQPAWQVQVSVRQGTVVDTADTWTSSRASHTQASPEGYLGAAVVPSTSFALRDLLPFRLRQSTPLVRTSVVEYVVQQGDTVSDIAVRFGLSESTVVWANPELDTDPDFLTIGQKMVILPVDGVLHTVARGETVESIASKYQVEPRAIYEYPGNALSLPYTLVVGQTLIVPGGIRPAPPRPVAATAPAAAPAQSASAPLSTTPQVSAPAGAPVGEGVFVWPMAGTITQYFGRGHLGIDLYAQRGTPIYAADAGYVSAVRYTCDTWWCGYGRWVVIDHGNGLQTLYAHLASATVQPGDTVARGQQIGTCGDVGKATGPHLHFEVLRDGTRMNPLAFLP